MSDSVTITPVRSSRELRKFIHYPFSLYRDDPYWVPPLLSERRTFFNSRKNPFFDHAEVQLWLALKGQRVVGRISSHIDRRHLETNNDHTAMFGHFDCENDSKVAEALLSKAADWAREQSMSTLRGPLNFSQNHECGMLIEEFDHAPVMGMPYNPRYLPELIEKCGFTKAMDLLSYRLHRSMVGGDEQRLPPKLLRVAEGLRRRSRVTIRKIDLEKNFEPEIETTRRLYNDGWRDNWGFVPATRDEYHKLAHDLRPAMDPRLGLLAEVEGEPVGFALSVLDLNPMLAQLRGRLIPFGWVKALLLRRQMRNLRLILFGVLKNARGRGADALLILETFQATLDAGYDGIELAWILETNAPVRRLVEGLGKDYGVAVQRRHRIYEMQL